MAQDSVCYIRGGWAGVAMRRRERKVSSRTRRTDTAATLLGRKPGWSFIIVCWLLRRVWGCLLIDLNPFITHTSGSGFLEWEGLAPCGTPPCKTPPSV